MISVVPAESLLDHTDNLAALFSSTFGLAGFLDNNPSWNELKMEVGLDKLAGKVEKIYTRNSLLDESGTTVAFLRSSQGDLCEK